MPTPEGRIRAKFDRALKGLEECYKFKPVQMGLGAPSLDYLFCVRSNFVAVELKRDANHKMSGRQSQTAKEIRAAGGLVLLVYDDRSIERAIRILANLKPWHERCKKIAYNKAWNKSHPITAVQRREAKLKYRNGLGGGQQEYKELLQKQDGHCFFCDRVPDEEAYGVLCVDHCHETHRARGLLCRQHNSALGLFGDNEAGVLKLLEYVRGKK